MEECPHCGATVNSEDKICWYCDSHLGTDDTTNHSISSDLSAIPQRTMDIISDYGMLLDELGEEKSSKLLRPTSILPHPKEKIENALKAALDIVKNQSFRHQLETVLICLEDFIPDIEVPEDTDDNFNLWLSRKDWNNPKAKDFLELTIAKHFTNKYGDNAPEKLEEFMKELRKADNK